MKFDQFNLIRFGIEKFELNQDRKTDEKNRIKSNFHSIQNLTNFRWKWFSEREKEKATITFTLTN